jgi:hypothetical protein
MVAVASSSAGVTFACQPDRAGNRLVFPYVVTNGSSEDVYVMDATPSLDMQDHVWRADPNAVVAWLGAGDFAHIMKGIAPLPRDKRVWQRVIPLAAKVSPGESLQRRLEIPLPLVETGPYHPELRLRDYEQHEIKGVCVLIEFLESSVEGFVATPVDYAPNLFQVRGSNTPAQVQRVGQCFPARQLTILKRPDNFPRPD